MNSLLDLVNDWLVILFGVITAMIGWAFKWQNDKNDSLQERVGKLEQQSARDDVRIGHIEELAKETRDNVKSLVDKLL